MRTLAVRVTLLAFLPLVGACGTAGSQNLLEMDRPTREGRALSLDDQGELAWGLLFSTPSPVFGRSLAENQGRDRPSSGIPSGSRQEK